MSEKTFSTGTTSALRSFSLLCTFDLMSVGIIEVMMFLMIWKLYASSWRTTDEPMNVKMSIMLCSTWSGSSVAV